LSEKKKVLKDNPATENQQAFSEGSMYLPTRNKRINCGLTECIPSY
jgi:hypothetical protein